MLRQTFKSVVARRRRLALTVVAVMLGVTMVTASLTVALALDDAIDAAVEAVPGAADVVVRAERGRQQGPRSSPTRWSTRSAVCPMWYAPTERWPGMPS